MVKKLRELVKEDAITLNRRDDLMVLNGKIYLAANHLGRLTIFEIGGI